MLKRCIALLLCAAVSAPALAGGWGGYHYGGHYKHRGHGGSGDALLAGLVIGGLVGYFIGEDRHYRRHSRGHYYYRHDPWYDDYSHYGYHDRVYYREYVPAAPPPRRVVVTETEQVAGHACRMTREYTTRIEIDGRMREAYGTKCLIGDGSWVLGPPKLVPEFN